MARGLRLVATLLVVHALAFAVAARADDGHRREPPPSAGAVAVAWLEHLAAIARGSLDLGPSPGPRGGTVAGQIGRGLGPTLVLLGTALALAVPAGLALGVAAVDARAARVRGGTGILAAVGFAMPAFYLGIVGIRGSRALATLTGSDALLLPASGFGLDRHLVLPVVALALRPAAELAQLAAELLAAEAGAEHLRMARAKGARGLRLLRHALASIAPTLIAAVASTLRYLVSSAIVVELLFNWPGIGLALARAIAPRIDGRPPSLTLFHPPTVAALVVVWTLLYLLAGLAAELAAARIDPRRAPR